MISFGDGSINIAQAGLCRKVKVCRRKCCTRSEHTFDRVRDLLPAGRFFKHRRGNIGREHLAKNVASEERQPDHAGARKESCQSVIGMCLVGKRGLDVAKLEDRLRGEV